MNELTQDLSLAQARSLIDSYAFDLGRDHAEKLLEYWLDMYHANWIRLATIEALYLGRYKAISIEQILNVWLRIGTPNPHFTYEFERLICRKLPKHLCDLSDLSASPFESNTISLDSLDKPKSEMSATAELSERQTPTATQEKDSPNLKKAVNNPASSRSSVSLISNWGLSYNPVWSDFTAGTKIIHQFIPLPDMSSFFTRLKTFGEEN
ncbi:hypothetical protein C7B62_13395 [Pleurocapsa sp. CCALA 161]|uniref:hypothetical protein n=1 Tax=Pleurocapsa sp. CCALA 161 TaxID=2107688 RepID=UPI000D078B6F|nr:hypothetical protein [Pleurocapsa sp. CCALA 161]PSB09366.1 hypothetical protein C7B62_13395 [Pleurocapsa sp. CCALA 161]